MDVKKIVTDWLRENHFDGLYAGYDCACALETLMDCYDGGIPDCMPGIKRPCDCGEGHDYHIAPKKAKEEN